LPNYVYNSTQQSNIIYAKTNSHKSSLSLEYKVLSRIIPIFLLLLSTLKTFTLSSPTHTLP